MKLSSSTIMFDISPYPKSRTICPIDFLILSLYNEDVRIVSERLLKGMMEKHPQARMALTDWVTRIRSNNPNGFNELRSMISNSVDRVPNKQGYNYDIYVFNIMKGHFRLIVGINFEASCIYIKDFLTHAEYDSW